MRFHLGRPILVLLAVATVCGAATWLRRPAPRADLTVWTFADSHAAAYRQLAPGFERTTGQSVRVDLIPPAALNTRLASAFMAGSSADVPDAVELQMSTAGPYFRPPAADVGLLPLNYYLETTGFRTIPSPDAPGEEGWHARCAADGQVYTFHDSRWSPDPSRARPDAWIDRIVPARFVPWSKGGTIFGVPHDVHPVTITYREDLFREAGVDLAAARTWAELREKCLGYQAYRRARGRGGYAMELFEAVPDELLLLVLQRHVQVVDSDGRIHLNDPRVADTLAFYATLVAGPTRIAGESGGAWVRDLSDGYFAAALTADWRVNDLRTASGELDGKLRMMPLPRFDPDDAPTSTWDGTMIGIPRASPHPDDAWRLIERLYLSDAGIETRFRDTGILPPLRDAWTNPIFHQPDPLYGGQKTAELFITLADQVPDRHLSWATPVASGALGYVLNQARGYLASGQPPDGLRAYVAGQLARAEAYVWRGVEHGSVEGMTESE